MQSRQRLKVSDLHVSGGAAIATLPPRPPPPATRHQRVDELSFSAPTETIGLMQEISRSFAAFIVPAPQTHLSHL